MQQGAVDLYAGITICIHIPLCGVVARKTVLSNDGVLGAAEYLRMRRKISGNLTQSLGPISPQARGRRSRKTHREGGFPSISTLSYNSDRPGMVARCTTRGQCGSCVLGRGE